ELFHPTKNKDTMNQHDGLARIAVPLLGILLVAINLRPVITAVGPVLPALGEDLSLGPSALGLLGALPIAMFGLVSAMVQNLIARFGVERTTAGALALLTVATVLRSWPGPHANLWIGTVLVGAAIAIGNVAVPVLVKQSFPRATALVTSIYVAVLGIFAGLAAALAVPLAAASTAGWRLSLGVWAVLTCLGLVCWVMHALRSSPPRDRASMSTSARRSPARPSVSGRHDGHLAGADSGRAVGHRARPRHRRFVRRRAQPHRHARQRSDHRQPSVLDGTGNRLCHCGAGSVSGGPGAGLEYPGRARHHRHHRRWRHRQWHAGRTRAGAR